VRLLTWQQRCSEALEVAEDALGANRDDPDLFEAAAHAARGAGQDELALNYAREAATLDPATAARRGFYAELMIKQGRLEDIGDTLANFLADTPNSELAERAVMLLLELVRSRSPEYVDERHIQQLEILVDAKQDQLPVELLWDVARVANQLNLEHLAAKVFAAATQRTKLDLGTVPPTAKLFIDQIAKRSLGNLTERDGRAAAAQQLLEAGLCAQATNESWRSEAAFRLAAYLAPENPAAQINAGFVHLARGSVDAAWEQFASITRIYDNHMAFVAWPRAKTERGWPSMPFPCATGFEALKPADAEWPVITVITPSYNQAKYVEETILSVLNQEYPRLQYIVVDGLSKDGSVEIIRRYESRLDVVIIEKDKGQTEAINKGLAHAKGDIVTWVNSDDMLAPGALHIAALTWLRTRADLLYGVCLVHSDHRFILANLPAAEQESFTLLHLGEIFKYWMKGHFFYQPEVFFSRRILDLAGGTLDDTLYYTMDYKFWLQCAQNCARIEKIHWPFAIFRQHREQKTANLLDCMLEQAEVRDQFVRIEPDAARRMEVRTRLHRAFDRSQVRVGVVSSRLGKIFSEDAADDLARELEDDGFEVELVASASALANETDLVIKLVHLQADVDEIRALRGSGYRGAVVGWFWDNHHHLFANFEVAEELDVLLPGHAFAGAYLKNRKAVLGPSVPLCVTQWSYSEARDLFSSLADRPRSDRLYGGFVRYAFAKKRNGLIEGLIGEGCAGISFLEETNLKKYFGLSAADRFSDWMSHKVSVCLPLAGDLSQRMFDALLAGQIPIVAADIHDLDAVIPPEFQASLPVIRFERYDTGEVISAHGRALDRFEADGMEGVRRRHVYALKNHTFPSRIRSVIRHAEVLSQQL
jgi:glycosyltransferase involved in cell wall biosynthesis